MTIMSIIITEDDLCKNSEQTSEKSAAVCRYSILPQICGQSANDRNHKYDSKYHISAYNYNTRTGFRAHKNIWGRGRLSSALPITRHQVETKAIT